jgi:hypothetical protein
VSAGFSNSAIGFWYAKLFEILTVVAAKEAQKQLENAPEKNLAV